MRSLARVLAIDDDQNMLAMIELILGQKNLGLLTSQSSTGAMDILKDNQLDISAIILDWNMPDGEGINLLKKIKKVDELKYIPVIMLTGRNSAQDIEEGITAGCYYYLTKPFTPRVLLTLTEAAINDFEKIRTFHLEVDDSLVIPVLLNEGRFVLRTPEQGELLARWLGQACPDPVSARLGLSELLTNAIEHGNLDITYDEKTELIKAHSLKEEVQNRLQMKEYRHRKVELLYKNSFNLIEFIVKDEGKGFDFEKYLSMHPNRAFDNHGRGIAMANTFSFDRLHYHAPGNKVSALIHKTASTQK